MGGGWYCLRVGFGRPIEFAEVLVVTRKLVMSRHSTVAIATRLRAGRSGFYAR
jgi:hypothetical protein